MVHGLEFTALSTIFWATSASLAEITMIFLNLNLLWNPGKTIKSFQRTVQEYIYNIYIQHIKSCSTKIHTQIYPYRIINYIIYNAFSNTCFSLKLTAWPYFFGVPSRWPVVPNMPRRDGWGSGRSLMALAHVSPGPASETLEIWTSSQIFSAFFFKIRTYTK